MKTALTFVGLIVLAASAQAASFSECPAVGNDTLGCELLITVTAQSHGTATAFTVTTASPDQGPYDGVEDTLIGVINKTDSTLTSVGLSSSLDIFGFDGDGACTYINCPGATDPSGYAPAGVTFSGINAAETAGTVNFAPGLKDGASTWFSLEDAISANQIQPTGAPEPGSIVLLGLGLTGLAAAMRRRKA